MLVAEQHEPDELDWVAERIAHGSHGDRRRELDRVAVDAGRDRREGDAPAAELRRDLERAAMARGQQVRLVLPAAVPDGADRVDHVPGRQPPTRSRLRITGRATAELAALGRDLRAARAMDRAVDAAASEQRLVRRVDDRVDRLLR